MFVADKSLKPYIDILKDNGYYEFVSLNQEQLAEDEDKVVYYLEYRCPYELYERGKTWAIIQLHHLVIAVNEFEAEASFEGIKKANDQRAIITRPKYKKGKYGLIIDHISNRKMLIPYKQQIVFDSSYKPPVEPGEFYPKVTPGEAEAYEKFCDILPKLDEDFFEDRLVCITPVNINHAQCSNEYDNLVLIDSQTNRLKSNILDRHLGLYAGIKHKENIFVVTFYTRSSFLINNDKCHRFSVIYELPASENKIEQIQLQAEVLQKIYNRYDIAREEAQEIYSNYGQQDTIECWNEIKQVYSNLIQGKEIHYIPAEEINRDFNTLWLNKEIFFAPGDKRVKIVKKYNG